MKTLFAAAVAVSMLTGTVATTAYADNDYRGDRHYDRRDHDRGRHDYRGHDRRDYRGNNWRDDRSDHRYDRRYDRRHDYRHSDRRYSNWDRRDAYRAGYVHGRYDRGRYIVPRGYYRHSWRHGDHLPRSYYSSRYIVNDYHAYHLHRPPYGYHWVRVNNDVVLAAVASGLVVSVVNGLFY